MRDRCPRVFLAFTVAALLAPTHAAGQDQRDTTSGGAVPRTSWGAPDLQGVWSYATLTPLQRPSSLEDREFYTPEEAATRDTAVTLDSPPRAGDVGSYNALWFDRGRVLTDRRTALIVDPPDGRLPTRSDAETRIAAAREYRSAHSADSWLDRSNWDRCITYHGVPPISTGYNNTYQIFQTADYVAILVENIHDVRIIPIDGPPQLTDDVRQWNGDSRGHWEGDTLVVETTNYSDQTQLRFPSSRHTRAVERFRRVSEGMIDYQFTIEDPSVYTGPWTAVRPMPRLDGYVVYEYACHEGNYAMFNILGSARVEEQVATQEEGSR